MNQLLREINTRKVLFWMGAHGIDAADQSTVLDPPFIDRQMVEALRPNVDSIVEYVASPKAMREGTKGMVYNSSEKYAAQHLFGPRAHREVADALVPVLSSMIRGFAADPEIDPVAKPKTRRDDPGALGAVTYNFPVNSGTASNKSETRP